MEKLLYPFQFFSAEGEKKPWGSEIYKVADLGVIDSRIRSGWFGGNTVSELMQTYLERAVGETSFEWYGTQFPVMVKYMDVAGKTSLHVNADDETAAQRYDAFGKTALWYIADAEPEAVLYLGFRREVTASEFYARCQDGTVEEILNRVHPQKGESCLIPPGRVHAASGKLKIIEIAECSELFFRLYDWKRDRELHLEEAFDLIDFHACELPEPEAHGHEHITERIAETPQFTVTRIRLTDPLHIYAEKFESFLLYICAEGEAAVQVPSEKGMDSYVLATGEVMLIPAELKDFFLAPRSAGTVLLETVMPKRPMEDSYIDPDAEPYADDEEPCGHHHSE